MEASVWKGSSLCEEFSDYVLFDEETESILVLCDLAGNC